MLHFAAKHLLAHPCSPLGLLPTFAKPMVMIRKFLGSECSIAHIYVELGGGRIGIDMFTHAVLKPSETMKDSSRDDHMMTLVGCWNMIGMGK